MHDDERPTHRLTARYRPVAGDTAEANELAEWLRARVAGHTVRQLADGFPCSRTQWSEFLRGRKLIPLSVLDSVVTKLVPRQDQQLHRGLGHELLRAATDADAIRRAESAPAASPGGSPHEYEMRLDNARQGQIEAQETVQSLTLLIYAFIRAMADLNQRCRTLEAERDQVRLQLHQQESATTANQHRAAQIRRRSAERQRRLAEAERRLTETERRHAEFEERLARARREQQQAEELRIEAFQQAEENRRAFKQLTGRDSPAGSSGEAPGQVPAPEPSEYDRFLEIADAELDSHNARMDTIREQIGLPALTAPTGPRTIVGQVVRTSSTDGADSADNTLIGQNPVPGPSADDADNASGAPAEAPAPVAGKTDRHGFGAEPPEGGPRRRRRGSGRGPVSALAGTACLALLAVGGWFLWIHEPASFPETEALVALRNAQNGKGTFRIGVKDNQPGLSTNEGTKEKPRWIGAEIEYARHIAEFMRIPPENIHFEPLGSNTRETLLRNGDVHMVVGTYGISDKRKKEVDFAGPYYQTKQKVMLRKGQGDDEAEFRDESGAMGSEIVRSVANLKDNPRIPLCTVEKSTSLDRLKKEGFTQVAALTDYEDCMEGLQEKDGSDGYRYDGVVTDEIILSGLKNNSPDGDKLMIIRDGLGEAEQYGIGLKKDNGALKEKICEAIRSIEADQVEKIYEEISEETSTQVIPDPTEC